VQFVVGDYRFMSAAAVNGDIDGKDNVSHLLFSPCYGTSPTVCVIGWAVRINSRNGKTQS
jgi:hypothetical protein